CRGTWPCRRRQRHWPFRGRPAPVCTSPLLPTLCLSPRESDRDWLAPQRDRLVWSSRPSPDQAGCASRLALHPSNVVAWQTDQLVRTSWLFVGDRCSENSLPLFVLRPTSFRPRHSGRRACFSGRCPCMSATV